MKEFASCNRTCMAIAAKGRNYAGVFHKGDTGERCINFKGGRTEGNGYILLLMPEHPFANRKGYIYEHRVIMEKSLGRYLTPEEVVHHKNFDKKDNRIENLMLFENDAAHHRHHGTLGTRRRGARQ